mmetsp:Transcript_36450/g.84807  ORF Transcript_36450/g.84807 Transcript_36450/m.84807 type:complete len:395 (+) Transcript_36450:98-1282(+)
MPGSENGTTLIGAEKFPARDSFDDMNLPDDLLRGIYSHDFERPTPIQRRAILPVAGGRDTIGQAESGAGKMTTCLIGTLARINVSILACQVLVLMPTRELASATHKTASMLGEYLGVRCCVCTGGTSMRTDVENLRAGPHLVLGTPGRVLDMTRKRFLDVGHLRSLALVEADDLLARGFTEQIHNVLGMLKPEVQLCLFSATLPQDLLCFAKKLMRDPVQILMTKNSELTLQGINQFYATVEEEDCKLQVLTDLYERLATIPCVIYCNTEQKAKTLAQSLQVRGFPVSVMHGDLNHGEMQLAMREFRSGSSQVLISTDLSARAVEVAHVSLVINYDVPARTENYLFRIGRKGRFGRKGVAISFVTSEEVGAVHELARHYATQIEELPADIADRI